MALQDLYLLSPEASLAAGAVVVLLADLAGARRGLLGVLLAVALLAPAAMAVALWGEVAGWWSLVAPLPGEVAGVFLPGALGAMVVDRYAIFFKLLFLGSAGLVLMASWGYGSRLRPGMGEYCVLVLVSVVGMMLLAAATELVTVYVALELATLPLVALAAFHGDGRGAEAGLKLLVLAAVSSGVLLYGMALTFGYLGSTRLSAMAGVVEGVAAGGGGPFGAPLLAVGVVMMVAGFGFKIAVVPFHMWVPDVYEGAPTPITAFLSVASKAAGFAVLLRVLSTAFGSLEMDWALLLAGVAAASMTVGNLAAMAQRSVKRMLAYSTVAHAGYMVVGLAAVASRTPDQVGLGSSTLLFYLAGYAVTNLGAFFAVMALAERTGSEEIGRFAGVGRRAPLAAIVLTLCLLSLTGIPPTVGFMAKLFVFSAAVKAGLTWLVALGAVNSVISAYYYLRVVRVMYAEPVEEGREAMAPVPLAVAMGVASVGVLLLGVWPQTLARIADQAARLAFR